MICLLLVFYILKGFIFFDKLLIINKIHMIELGKVNLCMIFMLFVNYIRAYFFFTKWPV